MFRVFFFLSLTVSQHKVVLLYLPILIACLDASTTESSMHIQLCARPCTLGKECFFLMSAPKMTSHNFAGDKVIKCSDCTAGGENVRSQQLRTHPQFYG